MMDKTSLHSLTSYFCSELITPLPSSPTTPLYHFFFAGCEPVHAIGVGQQFRASVRRPQSSIEECSRRAGPAEEGLE